MATFKTDIEIAQEAVLLPITKIATTAGIDEECLEQSSTAGTRQKWITDR